MTDPSLPVSHHLVGKFSGRVVGFHHVRVPVNDAWTSRNWYMEVLGFIPVLDLQEAQGLVGVVLRHPRGFMVGLHQDPQRAEALRGFALLGLTLSDREQLQQWSDELERAGHPHGPVEEGHLGWYMDIPDPNGILVRLHTGTAPDAEEA